MSEAVELTIREAIPSDAAQLLAVSRKIGEETEFLVMDKQGINLPEELLAIQLADLYESDANVLLLALLGDQIVGQASLKSAPEKRIAHIAELGVSILREYWGMGLGRVLIEELMDWAEASGKIFRLELTVQAQNTRALALYDKLGFKQEGILARGARGDDGRFLDVVLMSKMIDN